MDYAYQQVLNVLDTDGWSDFEREFPLAAAQVRMDVERVAGKLKAVEWHTSGDGSWPHNSAEQQVIGYLENARETTY